HVLQNYPIRHAYLSDVNAEIILVYQTIQQRLGSLLEALQEYQARYDFMSESSRRDYFYEIRKSYNEKKAAVYLPFSEACIERAAHIIFLNKTCFNGLFRFNHKGEFNAPFGRYVKPRILNAENLKRVSGILQSVELKTADFEMMNERPDYQHSFVYLDPPYRPLSSTARFTAYCTQTFGDPEQCQLAKLFQVLHAKGAKLMLSNSDPRNNDEADSFFDDLYAGFTISRVPCSRRINCVAGKRGQINEIVITNYEV
ncbi:MAG: Dam family site-specific DNA-(adenine-N6)-methyltransferase, partial [Bacteroidota bacterium]